MSKSILEEAVELTSGDRRQAYGHPIKHYGRTVKAIDAMFRGKVQERLAAGLPMFEPEDWAHIMILDKVSRAQTSYRRDNSVDIAGYAQCHEDVIAERGR